MDLATSGSSFRHVLHYSWSALSASFSSFRESEPPRLPSGSRRLPRRRTTRRRSRGLLSFAREILLRRPPPPPVWFSRTRMLYRGVFLSSSSSSSSSCFSSFSSFSFSSSSPSLSRSVPLFLRRPFPFRVTLSVRLSPFSSACCNPFCETSAPGRGGEVKASALPRS